MREEKENIEDVAKKLFVCLKTFKSIKDFDDDEDHYNNHGHHLCIRHQHRHHRHRSIHMQDV